MGKIRYYSTLAAAILFAGCSHEIHELRPSEYGEGVSVGYLATALQWEMPDDAGMPLKDLTLFVNGKGASVTKSYSSKQEVAEDLVQVPVGEYDILAAFNMAGSDGFDVSENTVSLKDPVSSPSQAWFGVTGAKVKKNAKTIAGIKLQRLLSSLSVNIANVPSGTKIVLSLSNVAANVDLSAKDGNGRYGLPSAESAGTLELATLTASAAGQIGVDRFNLLPTASAFERCMLFIDITTADGRVLNCTCDAPLMESGKHYSLDLEFNELRPYMYVDTYSINDWEEGWTVSGEILNPNE